MANTKVTLHFANERLDRAAYIAETVGFGEVVRVAEWVNRENKPVYEQILNTGVLVVFNEQRRIITMYIMTEKDLYGRYTKNNWGKPPKSLVDKVRKNKKMGYTENQPNFHKPGTKS